MENDYEDGYSEEDAAYWGEDFDEASFFDPDYEDPIEEWEDRCGYDPAYKGICHHVGTEDCSFFCPFHSLYFTNVDSDGDVSPKQPFDDLPF